jgi:hypothetical protein
MHGRLNRLRALALLLPLLSGCAAPVTLVKGKLEPRHFQFVTVVKQSGSEPGGWRAACIHAHITRTTGEFHLCRFGVEMPIKTELDGSISTPLAQRIASDCANQAAYAIFSLATPETPLGLACTSFKRTYNEILYRAIKGSTVKTQCHPKTTPVEFGR